MIYTVFPHNDDPWQDFATYKEAKDYAEENYAKSGYEIESTEGEIV